MNHKEIRHYAKELNISAGKLPMDELIRTIQRAEGNFDCYGSATIGLCDQTACAWRDDCLPSSVSTEAVAT